MKPALLILAAGLARRYGGLKQLEPVGAAGEALLDYGIFDALRAGFGHIVLVIRRDIESAVRAHTARIHDAPLTFAFQETEPLAGVARTKPWGTGHAVLSAAAWIDGPFAVMNADDFYGRQAFERLAAHLRATVRRAEDALVTYPLAATLSEHGGVSRALCTITPDGLLGPITEVHELERRGEQINGRSDAGEHVVDPDVPVSMNLWGFRPDVLASLERLFEVFLAGHREDEAAEFRLPDAVSDMIAHGRRVRALAGASAWMGMTFAADREQVCSRIARLVRAGEYPADLSARHSDRDG